LNKATKEVASVLRKNRFCHQILIAEAVFVSFLFSRRDWCLRFLFVSVFLFLLFQLLVLEFQQSKLLNQMVQAVLLNGKINGNSKELDQKQKDHGKENEVCGRLNSQQLGCPNGDAGENADNRQKEGADDPVDGIVNVEL
jgi:hypothetical protein